MDRSHSGRIGFHKEFGELHDAPLRVDNGDVVVRFLLDASSIEVFAQRGETSATELIFPTGATRSLNIVSDGPTPNVRGITIYALRPGRH